MFCNTTNLIMILHKKLTDTIIDCYFNVYKKLGYGFLEKVYENALLKELELNGIKATAQVPIKVQYKGFEVGNYFADILVEDKIILELKATPIVKEHIFQLLNYLRATDIEIGYVLSFGSEPKYERRIFSNDRKQ